MFIDKIPNRTSPPAILWRESYREGGREGGRVKKRTLANLSKLPQPLIGGIAGLLDGGTGAPKSADAGPAFEIVRSLPHGHVAAVQGTIRRLGLDKLLQGRGGVERRVRDLIEAMIIQRIISPGSKLAFHRALGSETATSSLALSAGLIDVAEREVYEALDWLIGEQSRIETALAKTHLVDGTLVLYDVSSCRRRAAPRRATWRGVAARSPSTATAGITGPTGHGSYTDCCVRPTARRSPSRCSRATRPTRRRSVIRSTS